jgi:hypothetical protein
MYSQYREFEGTVDEVQAQLEEFEGQRIHVTVHSVSESSELPPNNHTPVNAAFARFANAPASEHSKVPHDLTDNLDKHIYELSGR